MSMRRLLRGSISLTLGEIKTMVEIVSRERCLANAGDTRTEVVHIRLYYLRGDGISFSYTVGQVGGAAVPPNSIAFAVSDHRRNCATEIFSYDLFLRSFSHC